MSQHHQMVCEYIWLDGSGGLRSKSRTVYIKNDHGYDVTNPKLKYVLLRRHMSDIIPDWNYDGSSTGQAKGSSSEVVIKPKAVFKCPFRRDGSYLVMCDTYNSDDNSLPSNTRYYANQDDKAY